MSEFVDHYLLVATTVAFLVFVFWLGCKYQKYSMADERRAGYGQRTGDKAVISLVFVITVLAALYVMKGA